MPWRMWGRQQKPGEIVVKRGDTLGKIAKANKTTVSKLLELNKKLKNPNSIFVG